MEINKIYNENCLTGLSNIPDNSIDCCVTSPPYWGLRDYGTDEQLGLEDTPEKYAANMVAVFEEVRRVLKPEGTLWLNLGDSYFPNNGSRGNKTPAGDTLKGRDNTYQPAPKFKDCGLKGKDLVGIPWMTAFALRSAGWYLRQDIIWNKPNPMPESVTDRCTKSHEYIFLMSKSQRYYYDTEAIKTESLWDASKSKMPDGWDTQPGSHGSFHRNGREKGRKSGNKERKNGIDRGCPEGSGFNVCGSVPWEGATANKRSVWTVTTKPFSEAHFATFPEKLIIDCIKAGCPEGGIVLDPFMGAGTTAMVARKLNRNYIGFELNPEYVALAEKRLYNELGMFV